MNRQEVADLIERFVKGEDDPWEWGDFITCRLDDPYLDKIREECNYASENYPPEKPGQYCNEQGIRYLTELVVKLRK